MKKKYKLVKRDVECIDCSGRGEKSNYTGCGEDGYELGECGTCKGLGYRNYNFRACTSCGHEELHFSKKAMKFLKDISGRANSK